MQSQIFSFPFTDCFGKIIERNKFDYPYSYDEHGIWAAPEYKPGMAAHCSWSDRMIRDNSQEHEQITEEVFGDRGQWWNQREPDQIEHFLRIWFKKPDLKLLAVYEGCNVSNGYPYWRFEFLTESELSK